MLIIFLFPEEFVEDLNGFTPIGHFAITNPSKFIVFIEVFLLYLTFIDNNFIQYLHAILIISVSIDLPLCEFKDGL